MDRERCLYSAAAKPRGLRLRLRTLRAPICTFGSFGVVLLLTHFLSSDNALASNASLKATIRKNTRKHEWSQPRISKFFDIGGSADGTGQSYAKSYGWPGRLNRGFARDALESVVSLANSKFNLRIKDIQIDGAPRPDMINIYFFDSRTSGIPDELDGQCVYVGFDNTILCDADFLYRFQETAFAEKELDKAVPRERPPYELFEGRLSVRNAYLIHDLAYAHHAIVWALAHEIGHLVHQHKPVPAWRFAV